ncbi:MAG: GNAT family N-acetyltransferase [Acidobacteriota bacterium]
MSTPGTKKVSEPEIRLAVPGDEEVISSLIFEAFVPFREQYTDGAFEYTAASSETIRSRFPEGPIWLAYLGGEAVGTVSGLPEEERFYIRSMAIKPTAQRVGIGQKLLGSLEAYARERGFTKLFLYTTFVLPGAKLLYEKNGFYVLRETAPEEWFEMGGLEMEKELK